MTNEAAKRAIEHLASVAIVVAANNPKEAFALLLGAYAALAHTYPGATETFTVGRDVMQRGIEKPAGST